SRPLSYAALALALASLLLLAIELRRRRGDGALIAATGAVATMLLTAAVLRPVSIVSRGSRVGPKVVVLADRSRSVDLPGDREPTRREALRRAIAALTATKDARVAVLGFGDGAPSPWDEASDRKSAPAPRSDLARALSALAASPEERPSAVVVVS